MISSFLSIKLSLYVQLDGRFPLFTPYNKMASPTRRISKRYFPEVVQSARMLGYFYGKSGQTVFTDWKPRPWSKARTSCFFHWGFFRGYNGVWFWRLSDDFYLTFYLTRREKTPERNGVIQLKFYTWGKMDLCAPWIDPSATQVCFFIARDTFRHT